MSTYSYSSNLTGVNGFDPFIKRSDEMLKSTQEIASWFKKVALVHETHGKALVKSSGLNKKKKTPMSSFEIGSLSGAWRSFHAHLEDVGNAHIIAARDLQADVADKIANFVVEKTNARKRLVGEANKATTELKAAIAFLQKTKSTYDSKCKDADSAQQAHIKATSDSNTKPKKLQELQTRATKTLDSAVQADKDYQKALDKANERQKRYYEVEMPSILELFQTFEEERIHFLKSMFERAAIVQSALPSVYTQCAEDYLQVSSDITIPGDIQEYIEENIGTVAAPTPLEYQPYETDNPNFTTQTEDNPPPSNSETKEPTRNYGLTAEEEVRLTQHEKVAMLKSHLAEIDALIVAEQNSQKGMEKLIKFYAKDPKSREKAVNELESKKKKVEELQGTKEHLSQQLTELIQAEASAVPDDNPKMSGEMEVASVVAQARGLYSYQATNESELSFQVNDILNITEQDESGWWFAELNGRSGFIPSNYVSVLR